MSTMTTIRCYIIVNVQMCSKAFYFSKVGLGYIGNSAISLQKKSDINLQSWLSLGHYAFHNSVSLTRLQLPVLNSCLLYQASLLKLKFTNLKVAKALRSQDTFCLQLHQPNSKLVWLVSKKRIRVLRIRIQPEQRSMVASQLANYQPANVIHFCKVIQSYFGFKLKLGTQNQIPVSILVCIIP